MDKYPSAAPITSAAYLVELGNRCNDNNNNSSSNDDDNDIFFYGHAVVAACNATYDAVTGVPVDSDVLPLATGVRTNKPWPVYRQKFYVVVLMAAAHLAAGLVGVVNNSLVVLVVCRDAKMRSVTNNFIANLAVADLLVCIFVLPVTLFQNIYSEWLCGWVICKTVPYLQGVSVSASVNTLAGVALERYLAIFHPKTRKMSAHSAGLCLGAIWAIPAGLFVPWLIVYEQKLYRVSGFDYVACHADWPDPRLSTAFLLVVFFTCYLFPLSAVAWMYLRIGLRVWNRRVAGILGSNAERNIAKSRNRILKMLATVVALFTLAWFPLYAIKFRVLFGSTLTQGERNLVVNYLTPLAQWMGASNSCVNPFVYCYFSLTFRKEFREALNLCFCCKRVTRPEPV